MLTIRLALYIGLFYNTVQSRLHSSHAMRARLRGWIEKLSMFISRKYDLFR